MAGLVQRMRKHRRQERVKALLQTAGGVTALTFLLLLYFLSILPTTSAYFTSRAESEAAHFSATSFADNINLYPGKSKTNDSPTSGGPAFPVAQLVDSQIYLDFGTYPAGNKRNFPEVLILENISSRSLLLSWHFSDNLAPFFAPWQGSVSVEAGQQSDLGFKLDSDPDDIADEYAGTLHISAMNGFITYELPVRLRLVKQTGSRGRNVQVEQESDAQAEQESNAQAEQESDAQAEQESNAQAETVEQDITHVLTAEESVYLQPSKPSRNLPANSPQAGPHPNPLPEGEGIVVE